MGVFKTDRDLKKMITIQDLKSIVGSNVLVLDFIQDAGHGWIQIPKNLSFGLSFSRFSYQDEKNLYLEEDCDMTKYLNFLDKSGIKYNLNEIIYNGQCFIRAKNPND